MGNRERRSPLCPGIELDLFPLGLGLLHAGGLGATCLWEDLERAGDGLHVEPLQRERTTKLNTMQRDRQTRKTRDPSVLKDISNIGAGQSRIDRPVFEPAAIRCQQQNGPIQS